MKILAGNSNSPLAEAISAYLQLPLTDASVRRFSDMECFVEIHENVRGEDVFVIQSTSYPANDNLMELLLLTDAARRASAARLTAVIPYFGYARQDRKDQPRVALAAKLAANLVVAAGANRVISIDFHQHQLQGFFDIPVDHLLAAPVLTRYFLDKGLHGAVVVAPDTGAGKMARGFARWLQASFAIIDKRRPETNQSEVLNVVGKVKGKTCLIVDDMVDTAGTLVNAIWALKDRGADRIYAAVSHAILSGSASRRIQNSPVEEMVVTNTLHIPESRKFSKLKILSIADLLSQAIRHVHSNESVSKLFRIPGERLR